MNLKKLFKLSLIFFFIFFISGCTAEYNVEIYKEKVKINGKILEDDKEKWDEVIITDIDSGSGDEGLTYIDGIGYENEIKEITYKEMIDFRVTDSDLNPKLDGLKRIKNPWQLGLKYKNKFKLNETDEDGFIMAAGPTVCYDNFNVVSSDEDDIVVISTSVKNNCFNMYPNLESIKVKLKTNHKVVSSTADKEEKNTYTWNITKENAENKSLQIVLKQDEYVFNYDNRVVKFGVAIVVLVILGLLCYRKIKNNIM